MIQISLTGSVYTTVAVSVERFLTVCCSYRHSVTSSAADGSLSRIFHLSYTVPILVFSFAFNITRFFELRTIRKITNQTEWILVTEEQKFDDSHVDFTTYGNTDFQVINLLILE